MFKRDPVRDPVNNKGIMGEGFKTIPRGGQIDSNGVKPLPLNNNAFHVAHTGKNTHTGLFQNTKLKQARPEPDYQPRFKREGSDSSVPLALSGLTLEGHIYNRMDDQHRKNKTQHQPKAGDEQNLKKIVCLRPEVNEPGKTRRLLNEELAISANPLPSYGSSTKIEIAGPNSGDDNRSCNVIPKRTNGYCSFSQTVKRLRSTHKP